jgi:hypothetical protein
MIGFTWFDFDGPGAANKAATSLLSLLTAAISVDFKMESWFTELKKIAHCATRSRPFSRRHSASADFDDDLHCRDTHQKCRCHRLYLGSAVIRPPRMRLHTQANATAGRSDGTIPSTTRLCWSSRFETRWLPHTPLRHFASTRRNYRYFDSNCLPVTTNRSPSSPIIPWLAEPFIISLSPTPYYRTAFHRQLLWRGTPRFIITHAFISGPPYITPHHACITNTLQGLAISDILAAQHYELN